MPQPEWVVVGFLDDLAAGVHGPVPVTVRVGEPYVAQVVPVPVHILIATVGGLPRGGGEGLHGPRGPRHGFCITLRLVEELQFQAAGLVAVYVVAHVFGDFGRTVYGHALLQFGAHGIVKVRNCPGGCPIVHGDRYGEVEVVVGNLGGDALVAVHDHVPVGIVAVVVQLGVAGHVPVHEAKTHIGAAVALFQHVVQLVARVFIGQGVPQPRGIMVHVGPHTVQR